MLFGDFLNLIGELRRHRRERRACELHDNALKSLISVEMYLDKLRRQAEAHSDPLAAEIGCLQGPLREEARKLHEVMKQPLDVELRTRLGDSSVQALIVTEMQLDVLRRRGVAQSSHLGAELGRLRELVIEEVLKLRELMRQPIDVDSSKFLQFLREFVERFERETEIGARFVSELDEVQMPQKVCQELVRIVQEIMANFRRICFTQHVLIRLTATDSHWQLTIEGDGRARKDDPVVIRKPLRKPLRSIEDELTTESIPSGGTRLVVTVPKRQE